MLPTQRRQAILAEIRSASAVSADALARRFDVSVETVRRDLRELQRKGLLERVYGGATRPGGRSSEGSFAARAARHMDRKQAIAGLAASLVEPGETVIIDVGTTALAVARAYRRLARLEVRQGDRMLARSWTRLMPGRSVALPGGWAARVDPAGGSVRVLVR